MLMSWIIYFRLWSNMLSSCIVFTLHTYDIRIRNYNGMLIGSVEYWQCLEKHNTKPRDSIHVYENLINSLNFII